MTLVWPAGASAPGPGRGRRARQAARRARTSTLELYASPLPGRRRRAARRSPPTRPRSPSRCRRCATSSSAPRRRPATAAAYEAALAAVYDAVKAAAPAVRVAGEPRRRGRAEGDARRGRAPPTARAAARAPLMDELDFTPAPAPGKSLWPLAEPPHARHRPSAPAFGGTGAARRSLPLIVDGVASPRRSRAAELALYSSPSVGTTGVDEPTRRPPSRGAQGGRLPRRP